MNLEELGFAAVAVSNAPIQDTKQMLQKSTCLAWFAEEIEKKQEEEKAKPQAVS